MKDLTPTQEEQRLREVGRAIPPAPELGRLLAAAYAAQTNPQENTMLPNWIVRSFAGKSPALRLAVGTALLLAVLALSLVLPRGGSFAPATPAWAATEGYLLAFDFGDKDIAVVQPIVDQLKATVRSFKEAHGLPTGQAKGATAINSEHKVVKRVVKHTGETPAGATAPQTTEEQKQRMVVMVALPSTELLDELKAKLAAIPGLPEPELTDSTWFTKNSLPDPSEPGINLGLSLDGQAHVFNFPEGVSEEQMEQEINDWIQQNRPGSKSSVNVTITGDETKREIQVQVTCEDVKTAE